MKINAFIAFSLLSAPILAAPIWAAPVGMAAHVAGSVQLEHSGKRAPLKLLQRLEAGDKILPGAGANAIVVLFGNGARFQIGAGQKATIGADSVSGAQKMGDMAGPSAKVVKMLGGARVGATLSRPASSFQRLQPEFPGWMELANRRFEWLPLDGAATYTFTLFDQYDNVVWSVRTSQTGAEYPADWPPLIEKRPYLWRLSGFGTSGKPLAETRWGFLSVLAPEDAKDLAALAAELKNQATAEDKTPLLLLAEVYRSYGVVGRTLETLEDLRSDPAVLDAKNDVYESLSPFARALGGQ